MTVKDLRKYRDNIEELECISEQLSLKDSCSVVDTASKFPYSKHKTKEQGYVHGEDTSLLLNRQKELKKENEKIKEYISSIPIRRIRNALKFYCLMSADELNDREKKKFRECLIKNNPTWQNTAEYINEDDDEPLRKAVERHLKNVR